jgi:hypothetical protein
MRVAEEKITQRLLEKILVGVANKVEKGLTNQDRMKRLAEIN